MRPRPVLLTIALLLLPAAPAGAADTTVTSGDFFQRPYRVKVDPGDTVTWRITGSGHTVTSRRGAPAAFDSGTKGDGETFPFTFSVAGRYAYVCEIHPGLMDGVVQVGPDTVDPVISRVRARRGKKSVRVSFRLSEEARARATFRRAGKRVRTIRTKVLRQGGRSVVFRPKTLAPGRYRATLEATDLEGNAAKRVSTRFRVPEPKG